MGKYVISKTPKGKYYAELFTRNGELILSSQMYMARKGALKGLRCVSNHAKTAPVEDQTTKDYEVLPVPKFVIYKAKNKKFYFDFVCRNGKAVGTSHAYPNRVKAKAGIKTVKANSQSAYEKKTVKE